MEIVVFLCCMLYCCIGTEQLIITFGADNAATLYLDGVDGGMIDDWSKDLQVTIPPVTMQVAFKIVDWGGGKGFFASYDNGWSTADIDSWKCSSSISSDWNLKGFDDSSWNTPVISGLINGAMGSHPRILSSAAIFWSTSALTIYCRHNVKLPADYLMWTVQEWGRIYVNGLFQIGSHTNWLTVGYTFVNHTSIVALELGHSGSGYGFIGEYSMNRYTTADTRYWRCTDNQSFIGDNSTDWTLRDFDDSEWEIPSIVPHSDMNSFSPAAKWIWTSNASNHIYCRNDILSFPVPADHVKKDWINSARLELKAALNIKQNSKVAKNVILFLGDGMGMTTVWSARVYTGQRMHGQSGEEYQFAFEKFDHVALSKTYNVDTQVSDSAGTATAYLGGVKANAATLGVNENVQRRNCSVQAENSVSTILDWSLEKGKSVGIVTTTRMTHATPAAAYAHSAERYWETDTDMDQPKHNVNRDVDYNRQFGCKDIALQLVEDNPDIHVLLGGGRRSFLPNNDSDPEYPSQLTGKRSDGRDLIQEWKDMKAKNGLRHKFVWNKSQFDDVDPSTTDYLFGMFESSDMKFELERDTNTDPSLKEMTQKAIQILQKNQNGFFLLVEGGRIDHAHHAGKAMHALHETYAMDEALKAAIAMTDFEDTLIVVTADHSHSFTTSGYPSRGNDILAAVDLPENQPPLDGMPYMTLTYANGPGAPMFESRQNLTGINTTHKDFLQPAITPMEWETHGGEDVAIYAQGPMAHLFHGVHEQNYIAHVMAYASCVGQDQSHCSNIASKGRTVHHGSEIIIYLVFVLCILFSKFLS